MVGVRWGQGWWGQVGSGVVGVMWVRVGGVRWVGGKEVVLVGARG